MEEKAEAIEMTGDQVLGSFQAKLESKLTGFDPTIIITIIDAVVNLLKGCMTPAAKVTPQSLRQMCQQRGPLVRMRIRMALRDETDIRPHSDEGRRVMEAVFDAGSAAGDNELKAMIEKVL